MRAKCCAAEVFSPVPGGDIMWRRARLYAAAQRAGRSVWHSRLACLRRFQYAIARIAMQQMALTAKHAANPRALAPRQQRNVARRWLEFLPRCLYVSQAA